jgi:hypothetical protein
LAPCRLDALRQLLIAKLEREQVEGNIGGCNHRRISTIGGLASTADNPPEIALTPARTRGREAMNPKYLFKATLDSLACVVPLGGRRNVRVATSEAKLSDLHIRSPT